MTVIGVILLLGFGGLVGFMIGHNVARKKFFVPKSKSGGGSSPKSGDKKQNETV